MTAHDLHTRVGTTFQLLRNKGMTLANVSWAGPVLNSPRTGTDHVLDVLQQKCSVANWHGKALHLSWLPSIRTYVLILKQANQAEGLTDWGPKWACLSNDHTSITPCLSYPVHVLTGSFWAEYWSAAIQCLYIIIHLFELNIDLQLYNVYILLYILLSWILICSYTMFIYYYINFWAEYWSAAIQCLYIIIYPFEPNIDLQLYNVYILLNILLS
jgi:mRNA-degrading endonuclease YafQ of YafQ-DinJ toxin-antitoxin module